MIIQRLLVVADAHFASTSPESTADEAAFLAFLESVPQTGDALLLAGDLYDFWFAYRHVIPRRNFEITAALTRLARRVPVYMIGGNHDRWGDTFWNSFPGMTFDPHELKFHAASRSVHAIHGDGLHESRFRDSMLNSLIRSKLAIGAFRMIPPDLGFPVGHALGHDGRRPVSDTQIQAAAARQLQWATSHLTADPSVQLLVMGHTHLAALAEPRPNQWYLNPGPWLKEHCYAVVDQNGPRLERFSS